MNKGSLPTIQPKNPLTSGVTTPKYGPGILPASNLAPSMTQPIAPMTKDESGFGGFIHSMGSGLDDLSHWETQALTGIAGYYGLKKGAGYLGRLVEPMIERLMPQAFHDVLVPLAEAGIEMAPMAALV